MLFLFYKQQQKIVVLQMFRATEIVNLKLSQTNGFNYSLVQFFSGGKNTHGKQRNDCCNDVNNNKN